MKKKELIERAYSYFAFTFHYDDNDYVNEYRKEYGEIKDDFTEEELMEYIGHFLAKLYHKDGTGKIMDKFLTDIDFQGQVVEFSDFYYIFILKSYLNVDADDIIELDCVSGADHPFED